MSKPQYTSAAAQDLVDILDYIAKDKPSAAITWVEKIERKCIHIASHPKAGSLQPHLGEGVRVSLVGRYMIFYREVRGSVEILRVIAGGRDIKRL